MRRCAVPLALIAVLTAAPAARADYTPSEPVYEVVAETDRYVDSQGLKVQVDVYRPDAPGTFPVLVWFDVYYKDDPTGPVVNGERDYFVTRGYVFVHASSPGSNNSGGAYENAFSPREQQAAYDVVEWAGVQPWSDGRVGMQGLSYAAIIQYFVAAMRPPHLVTIYPAAAYSDLYREIVYTGGNLQAGYPVVWDANNRTYAYLPPLTHGPDPAATFTNYATAVANWRPIVADFVQHPYADGFYEVRSPRFTNPMIEVPFALDVGWRDDMVHGGPINYETVGSAWKRLVIGDWGHSETHRRDGGRFERLRWFDHHLKGLPSGVENDPPVRVFVKQAGGSGRWIEPAAWPVPGTEHRSFYLASGDALIDAPAADGAASYLYSPTRHSELVQTVDLGEAVRFETSPLEEPIDVVGYPELELYASTDARDTSWNVALYDVAPDGTATRLQRGMLRAAAREVDPDRSEPGRPWHTFERDLPVTPGATELYRVGIWPVSNRFAAGHRIRIVVSDSPSGQGAPALIPPYPATNTVWFGPSTPSRLLLPVLPS